MARSTRSDSDASSSSQVSDVEANSFKTSKMATKSKFATTSFVPPPGFSPVAFGESGFTETALKQSSKTNQSEVWLFRVPDGLSTSQLDGQVIPLPKDGSIQHVLELPTSHPNLPNRYQFHTIEVNQSSADAGSKDKKRRSNLATTATAADSQLIAMAAQVSVTQMAKLKEEEKKTFQSESAAELASITILVPKSNGEVEGKLTLASVQVKKLVHLSLLSPANDSVPTVEPVTSETKKKRQQPWDLLTGQFKPTGSYTSDCKSTETPTLSSSTTVTTKTESPSKKDKKRKEKDGDDKKEKKRNKKETQ